MMNIKIMQITSSYLFFMNIFWRDSNVNFLLLKSFARIIFAPREHVKRKGAAAIKLADENVLSTFFIIIIMSESC